MDVEVKAAFKDRRAAELALEHLVQEIGLDRTDIFIAARGNDNSSGTERAGADARGSLAEDRDAAPVLEGEIEMSVACEQAKIERVSEALKQSGGRVLRRRC
jgi:hypothetical protein